MPMSFDGPVASTSGWFIRPRAEETGSTGCAGRRRSSLPTGPYVMATAGHREPCDSRGSCTVLGAPGGESPSGDSTNFTVPRVGLRQHGAETGSGLLVPASSEPVTPRSAELLF